MAMASLREVRRLSIRFALRGEPYLLLIPVLGSDGQLLPLRLWSAEEVEALFARHAVPIRGEFTDSCSAWAAHRRYSEAVTAWKANYASAGAVALVAEVVLFHWLFA